MFYYPSSFYTIFNYCQIIGKEFKIAVILI